MVSTESQRATIYNAFGIIRGSVEPGNAIYAAPYCDTSKYMYVNFSQS